ncbi:hypothetical protein [Mesorhizobium sp.]|uniref:hypothetical protein n=1 Tax=Mesorhizobium sp. TaxID=1871066 RepID=UPI000FE98487|nr:hypothetical protein [Mesorhizobium sp.]RWE56386.1 MAG: hypothetical protein EOS67_18430 [Mesorhizobium sp.]
MSQFALIDELLPETVRIAKASVPLYRDLYEGRMLDNVTRLVLATLPTITKSTIVSAGAAALSDRVNSDYFQNTSGSTGEFLVLHRSIEEQRFIHDFFGAIQASQPPSSACTLFLGLPSHGSATAIPSSGIVVQHGIVDDRTAENCWAYLTKGILNKHGLHRINTIAGSATQLLLLTKYLSSRGLEKSPHTVPHITLTGDWLSRRVLEYLQSFWQATLIDRFSCSEFFGGASSTYPWREFVFDPTTYAEIVGLNSDSITSTGELCVTSLYPFVQRQPLIRYRTGDIFSQSDNGFVFHGRRGHCLFGPQGELALSGRDLYELLDELEIVERQSHSLAVDAVDHSVSGKPLVKGVASYDADRLDLFLKIWTKVDMQWFPKGRKLLQSRIEDGLRRMCRTSISNLVIEFAKAGSSMVLGYDKAGVIWEYSGDKQAIGRLVSKWSS